MAKQYLNQRDTLKMMAFPYNMILRVPIRDKRGPFLWHPSRAVRPFPQVNMNTLNALRSRGLLTTAATGEREVYRDYELTSTGRKRSGSPLAQAGPEARRTLADVRTLAAVKRSPRTKALQVGESVRPCQKLRPCRQVGRLRGAKRKGLQTSIPKDDRRTHKRSDRAGRGSQKRHRRQAA